MVQWDVIETLWGLVCYIIFLVYNSGVTPGLLFKNLLYFGDLFRSCPESPLPTFPDKI